MKRKIYRSMYRRIKDKNGAFFIGRGSVYFDDIFPYADENRRFIALHYRKGAQRKEFLDQAFLSETPNL